MVAVVPLGYVPDDKLFHGKPVYFFNLENLFAFPMVSPKRRA